MSHPSSIAHYRIQHKLGEGGMGVVYAAHDERLNRSVALKMIREAALTEESRKRLWREARAAAAVNHPNVCQVHEIGEDGGRLFIVMELLEGESLAEVVGRGPLPVPEAVETALGILAPLEVLHRRGLSHRDLKPSNVFRTAHGIKLLDFGLARMFAGTDGSEEAALTQPGTVVGTPHYMAPEQLLGQEVDGRADIFALGALLFEMLAGKRAFTGTSIAEVFHAIAYEQPPTISGSTAAAAVDRIVRRALAKKPQDRYQTAEAMAAELRAVSLAPDTGSAIQARALTRLMVLPFRMLRPDADTDFLAYSLPEAITSSLSGVESLVVRSTIVASRYDATKLDVKAIAAEAEVDVVLTGTLLRGGDQLRVSTQLVEAPGGTLLWSNTSQASLDDIFQLQDSLVQRIVDSLSLPLTAREQGLLKHDVPASAKAYEFYLRANQLAQRVSDAHLALDLYQKCVEEDPRYAPAWARLGRCYRVLAKFSEAAPKDYRDRAESAFQHAFALNPELPLTHHLYAYVEVERGQAVRAMTRLLDRLRSHPNDPQLYAGLVQALRYAGLLEASLAADRVTRRLDPNIRTSVGNTKFLAGDFASVAELSEGEDAADLAALALMALGRLEQARAIIAAKVKADNTPATRFFTNAVKALLDGDQRRCLELFQSVLRDFTDPEGTFHASRALAYCGETEEALAGLRLSVERGYCCLAPLQKDSWLDSVRRHPGFAELLAMAESHHQSAVRAFEAAGGSRWLS